MFLILGVCSIIRPLVFKKETRLFEIPFTIFATILLFFLCINGSGEQINIITREEGIALVKKYDGEFPTRFENDIYRYLSLDEQHFPNAKEWFEQPEMDRDYFMHLADRFRSPHIWKYENGQWKLRKTIFE